MALGILPCVNSCLLYDTCSESYLPPWPQDPVQGQAHSRLQRAFIKLRGHKGVEPLPRIPSLPLAQCMGHSCA
jgi:hypothetical protein